MEPWLERLVAWFSEGPSAVAYGALSLAAMVEYVIPPFPGDTITLLGAFLAARASYSPALVLLAVTAGSVFGAYLDYLVGWRLSRGPVEEMSGRARAAREKMAPVLDRFARHGASYIAINRFLPGIRALFFVAAGLVRLPLWKVLFFGAVSALAWNAALIGLGFLAASRFEVLLGWVRTYTSVVWIALLIAAALLVVRWAWMRRN
ncbi:MAG: DedA family protein [Myxococcota bacterium]|nr:DedA family protein [Myxococcota bacterium]